MKDYITRIEKNKAYKGKIEVVLGKKKNMSALTGLSDNQGYQMHKEKRGYEAKWNAIGQWR